jgi:hypothetical protein
MNHLHKELELEPDDVVEVTLDGRANVMLLDAANYERYKRGKAYRYHGGLGEQSPVRLPAPGSGKWHLAIDLGGFTGHVRAGIRLLRGSEVMS